MEDNSMTTAQTFTVESFTTGERRTVTATHWWDALADQPDPCFLVVRRSDGRYSARTLENEAFPVAGEHIGDTEQLVAESFRNAYAELRITAE